MHKMIFHFISAVHKVLLSVDTQLHSVVGWWWQQLQARRVRRGKSFNSNLKFTNTHSHCNNTSILQLSTANIPHCKDKFSLIVGSEAEAGCWIKAGSSSCFKHEENFILFHSLCSLSQDGLLLMVLLVLVLNFWLDCSQNRAEQSFVLIILFDGNK